MNNNDDLPSSPTSNSKKWNCPVCTYENWPKSTKCTICWAPNPASALIITEQQNASSGFQEHLDRPQQQQQQASDFQKWTCLVCTYLNWPKSLKCVQCLSKCHFDQHEQNADESQITNSTITCPSSSSSSSSSHCTINTTTASIADQVDLSATSFTSNIKSNSSSSSEPASPASESSSSSIYSQSTTTTTIKSGSLVVSLADVTNDVDSRYEQHHLTPDSPTYIKNQLNRTISEQVDSHSVSTDNSGCISPIANRSAQATAATKLTTSGSPFKIDQNVLNRSDERLSPSNSGSNISISSASNKPTTTTFSQTEQQQASCDANHQLDASIDDQRDISSINKWICSSCTYRNWPKSSKCVICFTLRPSTATATSATGTSSNCEIYPENIYLETTSQRNCYSTTSDLIEANQHDQPLERKRKNNYKLNNCYNNMVINNTHSVRRIGREKIDWVWLDACSGIVNGDSTPVILYLKSGGDLARQLTLIEANQLNRPSAFEVGYTLVHLAIRFKRNRILELLLENRDVSRVKRVPCTVSHTFAPELRRHLNNCFKQRKGEFPCCYATECVTFALPQEIEDLSPSAQQHLFDELLDRDVQKELEEDSPIINWSLEISVRLGSRLYALWNRSTGDCLLDSALQATWGVFDKENRLRRALSESLTEASHTLFARFKDAEIISTNDSLPYTLNKLQWEESWAVICSLASQPGSALEQFHVFVLAHILRRPIIVYGIKYVKSFRGEALCFANFQGIYLPLHWEAAFCWKSPIALGYTRGHFTALVPMESMSNCVIMDCNCEPSLNGSLACDHCKPNCGKKASVSKDDSDSINYCYLPLVDSDHELLPLQFLTRNEIGREEEIMRQYLDCCLTESGTLVAKQKLGNSYLMRQMIMEWLQFYRNMGNNNKSKNARAEAGSVCDDLLNENTDASNINYCLSDADSD